MASKVLSIEVGYSLTKVVEVDYKTKNSKVYNCFSFKTPEGALDDGYIRVTEEFGQRLRKEIDAYGIKTKQVVFSISSTKIANREVYIPFVKENRIESIIKANASDYFPVDLSAYQLSHSILDTVEAEGNNQYKMLVLAAPKALLESYYTLASKAGLTIAALDYSGNSIIPVIKGQCTEEVTMVIKIDERATLLTILKDRNIVLQRTVSYGADAAIDVVLNAKLQEETYGYSDAIDMLREKAYIRKSFDESVVDDEDVLSGDESYRKTRIEVTSSLEMLIGSIARVIDYYNSKSGEDSVKKIILTGLGGDFNGLGNLMTNELGIKLVVLTRAEGVNLDKAQKTDNVSLGEYLACIGAAIDPLDFIPDEHKSKKQLAAVSGQKNVNMSIDGGRLSVIVLVGGLVIAAALAVISVAGFITTSAQHQLLQSKVTELQPVEQIYNQYVSVNAAYQQVVAMYKTTQNPNEKLLEFMNEMELKMPSSINITAFNSTTERISIGIRVNSKEEAVSAINTIRKFTSISAITVSTLSEETTEAGTNVTFSIDCIYAKDIMNSGNTAAPAAQ